MGGFFSTEDQSNEAEAVDLKWIVHGSGSRFPLHMSHSDCTSRRFQSAKCRFKLDVRNPHVLFLPAALVYNFSDT